VENYREGFEKLVQDQSLLPNLLMKVGDKTDYPLAPQGLRVYWDTLYCFDGWKLQKNYYYDHCRIVDVNHVRKAWGSENDMMTALEAFAL